MFIFFILPIDICFEQWYIQNRRVTKMEINWFIIQCLIAAGLLQPGTTSAGLTAASQQVAAQTATLKAPAAKPGIVQHHR
jgi:hypothetical protein